MTEDRVPTPIPATIHASQFCPDRHPGMEHDEWAAMTENRVPTTVHRADCPLFAEGIEHEGFCPTDPQWRIRAMTEYRVPTTEPRYMLLRDRLIEHAPAPMVDQLIREVLAEQPAPPLNVEQVVNRIRERIVQRTNVEEWGRDALIEYGVVVDILDEVARDD